MGCCVGDCGFCCIVDLCCVFKCSDCGDCCVAHRPPCSDCSDRPEPKNTDSSTYIPAPVRDPAQEHSAKTANELAEMRNRLDADTQQDEAAILTEINQTMDELLDWIKKENQNTAYGVPLNINIDRLEQLNADLRKEVVGFIGKHVSNRLVMTDREVSTILGERNDATRRRNFGDFYKRIRREAITALLKTIEDSVQKQSESIEHEVQLRLKEVNASMASEVKAFEELQRAKARSDSELANKRVEYMYKEALCDVMLENISDNRRNA